MPGSIVILNVDASAAIVDARLLANRPTLGICVGMQVLFSTGVEHGITRPGLAQWPDMCLPYSDFAVAGGGFPVAVKDFGLVAAIGVSGLPSRDDHELSTATLAAHLGIKGIALP
ncbi:MAG: hypothetical protein EBT13_16300 [Rhodobacteraceae bacterium]|nr:hypothetical protein [Paracoccaceae bacterium]